MSDWVTAFLALGGNLGDREGNLQRAIGLLGDYEDIRVTAQSRLYETAPVGDAEQGWFLNAVIAVQTRLSAQALLATCLEIEVRLGRVRDPERRFGPRAIDLDILTYGNQVISTPELTIPHPCLHERAFVLVPMAEIAPDWRHPLQQKTVLQMLEALPKPDQTQTVRTYSSAASAPS